MSTLRETVRRRIGYLGYRTARRARGAVTAVVRALPALPWVSVHGWPDDEENALRVASALAAGGRRVHLLADDPARARVALLRASERARYPVGTPRIVRRRSVAGVTLFALSRVVVYTHGLYGSPETGRRRVHALLGHGHGPKSASAKGVAIQYGSDVGTSNSRVWGGQVVREQGIRSPVVVTGNAREDAFDEASPSDGLIALGVPAGSRVVLWLPTFRIGRSIRTTGAADGVPVSEDLGVAAAVSQLRAALESRGAVLLAKAHPNDRDDLHRLGVRVVETSELDAAGLSFYGFLARADALISDYSSVWVDFLASGRTVGLLFGDEREYADVRGFNTPPISEVAGALRLTGDTIDAFADAVATGGSWRPEERAALAARIGFGGRYPRTTATIDAINAALERKGLRPLP